MTPEARARTVIDQKLAAGWCVQDQKELNLGAGLGVAVPDNGPVDDGLFVDREPVGVIKAKHGDLQDFIGCYRPRNRHEGVESERFKYFDYETLTQRDKASLDLFWLKDDSLDNLDDLPPPDVLAQEIVEHLEAALLAFREVAASLPRSSPTP